MERSIEGLLGINPGQNARIENMGADLFENSNSFRSIVEQADQCLGVTTKGSLSPQLQFSPVVFAIAAHQALGELLNNKFPADIISLSIGENAAFVQQRITSLDKIIAGLNIRQRITEKPHEQGLLKGMIAILGANPHALHDWISKAGGRIAEIEAKMVNYNSPSQGVIAVKVKAGEGLETIRDIARKLGNALPIEGARAIALRLANAFHSEFTPYEEQNFQHDVLSVIEPKNFTSPSIDRRIYSPTLRRYITDGNYAFMSFFGQISSVVHFDEGSKIMEETGIKAAVGYDCTSSIVPIFKNNLKPASNLLLLNISDMQTLEDAALKIDSNFPSA